MASVTLKNGETVEVKGERPVPGSQAAHYGIRQCLECGDRFWPRRGDALYCSTSCRQANHNREMLRAKRLYRALYHWRKARGTGVKEQFAAICRGIDAWVREDREAGRKPPPPLDITAIDF